MTSPTILWADTLVDEVAAFPNTVRVSSLDEALAAERGCVVLIPGHDDPVDAAVLALLGAGFDVITTGTLTASDEDLENACASGQSTIHHTGLHQLLVELVAATTTQAPTTVSHIRVVEAFQGTVVADDRRHRAGVIAMAQAIVGAPPSDVEVRVEPGEQPTLLVRGLIDGVEFYRGETFAGAAAPTGHADDLPFGPFGGAISYALQVAADPGDLDMQWQLDRDDPALLHKLATDAIAATVAASPGILVADARPHYRPDDRLPA